MQIDNNQYMQKAIDEVINGAPVTSTAKNYGIPKSTLQDRVQKAKESRKPDLEVFINKNFQERYNSDMEKIAENTNLSSSLPLGNYDAQLEKFLEFIGKEVDSPFKPTKKPSNPVKGRVATLIATDWHVPFHNENVIKQVVADFKAQFGRGHLVIGGDFLDGYEMNSYSIQKSVTLDQEMAAGQILLEWLSQEFETVVLVDDNHLTGRWSKYIAKQLKPSIQKMLTDNKIDPYNLMISHLPNVSLARKKYKNGANIGWFYVIGDCLVAHAETHSAVAMKPVHNVMAWFDHTRKRLGIPEIRCYVEAHVHKLGGPYYVPGRDIALFESGCLASEEAVDYGWGADLKYKPIENGVVWLVQDDGRTVHNLTRVVRYPAE